VLIAINAQELRKALAEIEKAEANGFMFCEAVFNGDSIRQAFVVASYSDFMEKAHPTDERLNWGRGQRITRRFKFNGGKLIELPREEL